MIQDVHYLELLVIKNLPFLTPEHGSPRDKISSCILLGSKEYLSYVLEKVKGNIKKITQVFCFCLVEFKIRTRFSSFLKFYGKDGFRLKFSTKYKQSIVRKYFLRADLFKSANDDTCFLFLLDFFASKKDFSKCLNSENVLSKENTLKFAIILSTTNEINNSDFGKKKINFLQNQKEKKRIKIILEPEIEDYFLQIPIKRPNIFSLHMKLSKVYFHFKDERKFDIFKCILYEFFAAFDIQMQSSLSDHNWQIYKKNNSIKNYFGCNDCIGDDVKDKKRKEMDEEKIKAFEKKYPYMLNSSYIEILTRNLDFYYSIGFNNAHSEMMRNIFEMEKTKLFENEKKKRCMLGGENVGNIKNFFLKKNIKYTAPLKIKEFVQKINYFFKSKKIWNARYQELLQYNKWLCDDIAQKYLFYLFEKFPSYIFKKYVNDNLYVGISKTCNLEEIFDKLVEP